MLDHGRFVVGHVVADNTGTAIARGYRRGSSGGRSRSLRPHSGNDLNTNHLDAIAAPCLPQTFERGLT